MHSNSQELELLYCTIITEINHKIFSIISAVKYNLAYEHF